MNMESVITIVDYIPAYQSSIRKILTKIGWAEQYIVAMQEAASLFARDKEHYGVYLAFSNGITTGYLYVQ